MIIIQKKEFLKLILVWEFDGFARSTSHLIRALEEFQNLGIDFISYTQNIDISGPMGKANRYRRISASSVKCYCEENNL